MSQDLVEQSVCPVLVTAHFVVFELKYDSKFELVLYAIHHYYLVWVKG
jgi:hypothetical protein